VLTDPPPRIAIVTPSYNQRKYLEATVASVLGQNYPALSYHVQDGASQDGTVDLLNAYVGKSAGVANLTAAKPTLSMRLQNRRHRLRHHGYLNSDDTLLPGTLAYIAHVFQTRQTSILSTDIEYYRPGRIGNWAGGLSASRPPTLSFTSDRPKNMSLGRIRERRALAS